MFEIRMPKFDVNDNTVTVVEVYVSDGDYVSEGTVLFKAESTKMVKDIISEYNGYIKLHCKAFDTKQIGELTAVVYESKDELDASFGQTENNEKNSEVHATARAAELANQLGLDISEIAKFKGEGIIKTSDVEAFAERKKTEAKPAISNASVPTTINAYDRERVLIVGAGRLSEQVIDILLDDKDKYIAGVVDSYKTEYASYNFPLITCNVYDLPQKIDRALYDTVIIALGGDKNAMLFRKELYELYKQNGIKFTNAIGDNTNIRRAVRIGENNIIMHNCFVGTGAQIGNDNIISYGTCIGHHCVIGSHNLFAPGFMTPGSIKVGDDNIIMTGVNMINYVTIGNNVVLPVGYNVMQDIPDNTNLLR